MSLSTTGLSLDELLEHTSWIRALARRLASDADAAEDLVQDTVLAALRSRPASGVSVRQWLGSVVRNFARQSARTSQRRADREARVARPEAEPSALDLVARASAQRELVQAVIELEEPYRTTVLLRFFEGLPPRQIARELRVPVETVRTRLQRGVARLRVALDRAHGGNRNAWVVALLPVAGRPLGVVGTTAGALVMKAQIQIAIALLSVAGIFVAWRVMRDEPTAVAALATPEKPAIERREEPKPSEPALDPTRTVAESTPAAASSEPAKAVVPQPSAAATLRARVVDDLGRAVPGIEVALVADGEKLATAPRARSSTDGSLSWSAPATGAQLVSGDAGYATVLAGVYRGKVGTTEPVVVVAPRLMLSGHVVDEAGIGIEGAHVRVELAEGFRTRLAVVLDLSQNQEWSTESDAVGFFDLDSAPRIEDATLHASLDGYQPLRMPLPKASDANVLLTLKRPPAVDGYVRGRVVDPSNAPMEGARVAFGLDTMLTGKDGTFAFEISDTSAFNGRLKRKPTDLTAVKRGFLPARYEPTRDGDAIVWPSTVTLRLGGEPLAVSGRVLDHRGEPVRDAHVWLADATLLGAGDRGLLHVEAILGGDPGRTWNFVQTDGDGEFKIEGLVPREYELRAMDSNTLLRCEKKHVAAGTTGVELRLATDTLFPLVAGRVVSGNGAPVAGVHVFPMCDAFQARVDGRIVSTSHEALDGVTTDNEGRFELPNVPRSLVYLRVDGEPILPLEYGRYVEGDARFVKSIRELPADKIENLEIVVARRCHLQLEVADPQFADELSVLDVEGEPLELSIFVGNGRKEGPRAPIVDGRSNVIATPDTGRTLVLYKAGVELTRRPIELAPGDVQHVRL
jgi:RNA polymerase sigma-70 factor (ECF subfamily)